MVWIHGGGNSVGTAVDPIYDGRRLAEAGDVVVVTLNYRLAQLGFLADAALATTAGAVGNYGTLDQLEALRWVHANIAAFGGDPANVMVFGESAGGRNTCTLLAAPAAAGLFHRALIQSGACKFIDTRAEAQATADAVATALGCTGDRAACFRAATAEALIRANAQPVGALAASAYGSVIDGVTLVEQPEAAIRAGRHHAMPIAIGANADETGREAPAMLTEPQYVALVRAQLGPIADAALQQYPASAYPSPRAAYVRLTTDSRFVCPSREIAAGAAAAQAAIRRSEVRAAVRIVDIIAGSPRSTRSARCRPSTRRGWSSASATIATSRAWTARSRRAPAHRAPAATTLAIVAQVRVVTSSPNARAMTCMNTGPLGCGR